MIRSKPIKFLAGAAALPVVALAVAGCGGGSDNGGSASAATAPPKTPSGQAATVGTAQVGQPGHGPGRFTGAHPLPVRGGLGHEERLLRRLRDRVAPASGQR
jgi:hypothetical protein